MFLIRVFMVCMLPLSIHAYTFHASLDNSKPMLGEEVNLTLTFSYESVQKEEIEEYEIEEPKFENIQATLINEEEYQESNTTWKVKQVYSLIPKQTGKLLLSPLNLHVESIATAYQEVYNRNTYLEKVDLQTKELELNVQALPQGVKISGEYKLIANVNKKEVDEGQPITFTLALEGKGNLESLDFFTLNIPHTTIYTNASTALNKSFTIVSDRNYTIPAVMLKYYNPKSRSIELIDTSTFSIVLKSDSPIETKRNFHSFYWLLIVGCILLCSYWLYHKLSSMNPKNSFIRKLKKTKSREEFLRKVVPYMEKSKNLKRLIFKLESSNKETFKSLKKEIINEIHLHLKEKK